MKMTLTEQLISFLTMTNFFHLEIRFDLTSDHRERVKLNSIDSKLVSHNSTLGRQILLHGHWIIYISEMFTR